MAEPIAPLAPRAPLGLAADALSLEEITDRALVTVVASAPDVRARLGRAFGVALPDVGTSVVTDRGERLLGLQADRLYVLFEHTGACGDADADAIDAERALRERLEPAFDADGATDAGASDGSGNGADHVDAATAPDATASDAARDTDRAASGAGARSLLYSSDQSDGWAMLRLDGAASRRVLERLCPLDLHPDVFGPGAVARSVVEHLGVIVLREGDDAFVLLSPRSSARTFLHDIESVARHVRGGLT